MTIERFAHTQLSDDDLLLETSRLAGAERAATARLIAALAEVDARRLYLGEGCSSLFVYCTRVLHLSEHAAYGRIEAARASRRCPVLLDMLECGDLTLTSLCLLAPHLTDDNHRDVLARARHRTKREVEEIVAALRPRPDVPTLLRKIPESPIARVEALPAPASAEPSSPTVPAAAVPPMPVARTVVQPLAPERYKLQVTISQATRDKLRRAQDLMRHAVPSGDAAIILDRALDLLLSDLERKKIAASTRPRSDQPAAAARSRHIPAAVRRLVWQRDGGRCAFAGVRGRCGETGFLEFHHVRPFAGGGPPTEENIELRCRAHNQYEADLFFGAALTMRECAPGWDESSVWTELTLPP
jgi:hypothetical protein